jgi:hypothetical protein
MGESSRAWGPPRGAHCRREANEGARATGEAANNDLPLVPPFPSADPHASSGNCQNPESACRMWRLMTHLKNERHVPTDLDQRRRWSAVGDRPEWVWDTPPVILAPLCLGGEQQQSVCCGLRCRAVSPTTGTRARQAHCGARGAVGCFEDDRSGRGATEKVQPITREVDACRVTIVAIPPFVLYPSI